MAYVLLFSITFEWRLGFSEFNQFGHYRVGTGMYRLARRVPLPSPESLAHRSHIARLVSPLKRIRARVPFWHLAAHRIPTLWTLYRGLLRKSPTSLVRLPQCNLSSFSFVPPFYLKIRFRIGMLFRKNEHLTSLKTTKAQLVKGYKVIYVSLSYSLFFVI